MPIFSINSNPLSQQSIFIQCDCGNNDHLLKATYFENDDTDEHLYITFHLSPKPFHKRLWYALKYIFGVRSRYGAWDETLLTVHDAQAVQSFLQDFVVEKDTSLGT